MTNTEKKEPTEPREEPRDPAADLQRHFQEAIQNFNFSNMFTRPETGAAEDTTSASADQLRCIREFNHNLVAADYLCFDSAGGSRKCSVAICDHYNHARQCTENLLRDGNTQAKCHPVGPTESANLSRSLYFG